MKTLHIMRDGISDMHCMSDAYLADELEQEYAEKVPVNEVVKERRKQADEDALNKALSAISSSIK